MDLRRCGWYAPIENTKDGGNRNARTIENTIVAPSVGTEYRHWDVSFLLHLFNGGAVCCGECFVLTFVDGTYYWTYAGRVFWDIGCGFYGLIYSYKYLTCNS